MATNDILSLGVAELAAKIRQGELSSVGATRAVLGALRSGIPDCFNDAAA